MHQAENTETRVGAALEAFHSAFQEVAHELKSGRDFKTGLEESEGERRESEREREKERARERERDPPDPSAEPVTDGAAAAVRQCV